jgi:hypothetical protein
MISFTHIHRTIEKFKTTGLTFCVAGGAPRDLLLGATVSDIDLYVSCKGRSFEDIVALSNRALNQEGVPQPLSTYYMLPNKSKGLIEYSVSFNDKLQVILFDLPVEGFTEAILNTFDFGICKVAFNEDLTYLRTPDFERDVANRTLTLVGWHSSAGLVKSIETRLPKLLRKFPDYAFRATPESSFNPAIQARPPLRVRDQREPSPARAVLNRWYTSRPLFSDLSETYIVTSQPPVGHHASLIISDDYEEDPDSDSDSDWYHLMFDGPDEDPEVPF